jgi:hypothetical protein
LSWLREEGGHPILQASSSVSLLTSMRPAPFWQYRRSDALQKLRELMEAWISLEKPGKTQLELIEVQTGSYFGEDDIIRIEAITGGRSWTGFGSMRAKVSWETGLAYFLRRNQQGIA